MLSLPFSLFLLGLFTIVPFITWVFRTTLVPEKGFGGSNKPLRISVAFQQLFGAKPNPTSWAVVMSLVISITCFLYSAIIAFLPIEKTMDFVLAVILVILIIPSLITFGYDVSYMNTDMYAGAVMRVGEFFKTWNYQYLAWVPIPIIFGFSVVGTMLASLVFSYVVYYLLTRQPYIQIAGRRSR
jgi:hypothetical protein